MKSNLAPLASLIAAALVAACAAPPSMAPAPTRTIIMVWDGLRPDSINAQETPNLARLRDQGVNFADNHATFPTFTMMNGSSFATGAFPQHSGFYGNTFWTPPQGKTIPVGKSAAGGKQDYVAPVFTEDWRVLATLNETYGNEMLMVQNLFAAARAAGMSTATVGKSGAAFLQDLSRGGSFVDENMVLPRSLAVELQAAGIALPANVVNGYEGADAVTLAANNGNPTNRPGYVTFDTTAFDPAGQLAIPARDGSDRSQGAGEDAANRYMLSVYTRYILPRKQPMLSLIWFRTPDNNQHGYGPGSANARAGLRSQDARLGELLAALREQGLAESTNVVVVSDHGHSSVSGPFALYPLRAIEPSKTPLDGPAVNGAASGRTAARIGAVDPVGGYSFSGDVRSADLLTYRGFKAYDGNGCAASPMSGLDAAARPTLPLRVDASGALCGKAGTRYQALSATLAQPVASFKVPAPGGLPDDGIVIAANGGSDYFYLPGHDDALVRRLVTFLQQREEYGAIFVDTRYGAIPGTFPLAQVRLENGMRRDHGQPDVVVSYAWDDRAVIQGMPGIEFESFGPGQRGMHGSFGPTDVHNTLIAAGPSFRRATTVTDPSGNVDLAPTVAHVLGLALPQADGRILDEALEAPASRSAPSVVAHVLRPEADAGGLRFELPTDPSGATADAALVGHYSAELAVKDLTVDGRTYRYFDYARALRR